MHFKAEIDTADYAHAIYKIKRLAKILAVCVGIVVVFGSLGVIAYLYIAQFAAKHHKDPELIGIYITMATVTFIVLGICGILNAVWEIEEKARREFECKFTE